MFGANGCEGIDLGMPLAMAYMIPFANDGAVVAHDHGTDHWIGHGILPAVQGKLDASLHVCYFTSQMSLVSSNSAKL